MTHTAVQSSQVASVGYDRDTSVLEVEFRSGSTYQYLDVPQEVYQALMRGEGSFGARFTQMIKNGGFSYRKVSG